MQIMGEPIPYNPTPRLLGVILDRQLSFKKHAEEIAKAATSKIKIISAVGNTKWGWDKDHLKKLYFSYVRSKLDYAGPGWQPWLTKSNIEVLDNHRPTQKQPVRGPAPGNAGDQLRDPYG